MTSRKDFVLDCLSRTIKKPEYDGLHDKFLSGFFSSKQRRKVLQKNNLITRQGYILNQKRVIPSIVRHNFTSNLTRQPVASSSRKTRTVPPPAQKYVSSNELLEIINNYRNNELSESVITRDSRLSTGKKLNRTAVA